MNETVKRGRGHSVKVKRTLTLKSTTIDDFDAFLPMRKVLTKTPKIVVDNQDFE